VTSFAIRTLLAASGSARFEPLITWIEAIATGLLASVAYRAYGIDGVCLAAVTIYAIGCMARFMLIAGRLISAPEACFAGAIATLTVTALFGIGMNLPEGSQQIGLPLGLGVGAVLTLLTLGTARRVISQPLATSR